MSVAPIRHQIQVKAAPVRAFELFVGDIGRWWRKGMTIGATPHVDIVIEPRVGGRWFERGEDGRECDWGRVLAWEPPHRLLLAWQINQAFAFDPTLITELELTFAPAGGGSLVTLEHRDLHRLGVETAAQLNGGWPGLLALYGQLVDAAA
jgi:uncharacterized protein YndB with AHSA1/START domain